MSRQNLFAYTEVRPEPYPGYLSLNREADGRIMLTVRTPGEQGTKVAALVVPDEELDQLAHAILARRSIGEN